MQAVFLREKGFGYECCNRSAPGSQTETCRETGALEAETLRDEILPVYGEAAGRGGRFDTADDEAKGNGL